jgi:hypothetical protein
MGNSEVIKHCVSIAFPPTAPGGTPGFRQNVLSINIPTNSVSNSAEGNASTLYPINPITAIQYFDEGVEGFGHWKVLLSMKCERHLRKFRRADAKRFAIIEKKIKYILYLYFTVRGSLLRRELSHGFFSEDNQKRLTGPKTDIPIFEAKMEGDTRLVYTVDCVIGNSGQVSMIAIAQVVT